MGRTRRDSKADYSGEPLENDLAPDIDINFIGEAEPNVTLQAKLSPIHDPESATSVIGRARKNLAEGINIFMKKSIYENIDEHAQSDTSREVGGILLGGYYHCDSTDSTFVEISASIIAQHTEAGGAHVTFTHETWNEINRTKDEKYPDLSIVGWYHTHPRFGIFLSGQDRFIQNQFFSEVWNVAYVVDPVRHSRGFFRLDDGKLIECEGFHLYAPVIELAVVETKIMAQIKEFLSPAAIKKIIDEAVHSAIPKIKPLASSPSQRNVRDGVLVGLGALIAFLLYWNMRSNDKFRTAIEQWRKEINAISSRTAQTAAQLQELQQNLNAFLSKQPAASNPEAIAEYMMQKGDRLSEICKKYYGDGSVSIYKLVAVYNGIQNPDSVYVGRTIFLPPKAKLLGQK